MSDHTMGNTSTASQTSSSSVVQKYLPEAVELGGLMTSNNTTINFTAKAAFAIDTVERSVDDDGLTAQDVAALSLGAGGGWIASSAAAAGFGLATTPAGLIGLAVGGTIAFGIDNFPSVDPDAGPVKTWSYNPVTNTIEIRTFSITGQGWNAGIKGDIVHMAYQETTLDGKTVDRQQYSSWMEDGRAFMQ